MDKKKNIATPTIKDTIGCSSIEYNRKISKLSDLRARKVGVENEYIENIDTPIFLALKSDNLIVLRLYSILLQPIVSLIVGVARYVNSVSS